MNKLEQYLGKGWYSILKDEFSKPYMNVLSNFVQDRRSKNTVYPPSRAWNYKDCFNEANKLLDEKIKW